MRRETVDGAPWILTKEENRVRRAITMNPDLDRRIVEYMEREGTSYSRVVERAVQALFERVA